MKRLPLAQLAAVAITVSACAEGLGATSSESSRPSEPTVETTAASVSASDPGPTPFPSGEVELVARISGSADLEIGCHWVIDENRRKWEIKWPAGYQWAWDGETPTLELDTHEVARLGDSLRLRGTLGWYDEREVIVKFEPGVLDAQTDENGPAEFTVRRWASRHGLQLAWPTGNHGLGWWLFNTIDGATPDQKVEQLTGLREIHSVVKDAQGSVCMVGRGFTVTSVEFIEGDADG